MFDFLLNISTYAIYSFKNVHGFVSNFTGNYNRVKCQQLKQAAVGRTYPAKKPIFAFQNDMTFDTLT